MSLFQTQHPGQITHPPFVTTLPAQLALPDVPAVRFEQHHNLGLDADSREPIHGSQIDTLNLALILLDSFSYASQPNFPNCPKFQAVTSSKIQIAHNESEIFQVSNQNGNFPTDKFKRLNVSYDDTDPITTTPTIGSKNQRQIILACTLNDKAQLLSSCASSNEGGLVLIALEYITKDLSIWAKVWNLESNEDISRTVQSSCDSEAPPHPIQSFLVGLECFPQSSIIVLKNGNILIQVDDWINEYENCARSNGNPYFRVRKQHAFPEKITAMTSPQSKDDVILLIAFASNEIGLFIYKSGIILHAQKFDDIKVLGNIVNLQCVDQQEMIFVFVHGASTGHILGIKGNKDFHEMSVSKPIPVINKEDISCWFDSVYFDGNDNQGNPAYIFSDNRSRMFWKAALTRGDLSMDFLQPHPILKKDLRNPPETNKGIQISLNISKYKISH